MLRKYVVDLRSLAPEDRITAFKRMDSFAFLSSEIIGETGLEGAEIFWDSPEDFLTSPVFPSGCPCREG